MPIGAFAWGSVRQLSMPSAMNVHSTHCTFTAQAQGHRTKECGHLLGRNIYVNSITIDSYIGISGGGPRGLIATYL